MEDKLIEYSDKIIEALEAGVDFAGEQAPLLIQEVLGYYTFYYGVLFGVFLFVALIFWVLSSIIFISELKNNKGDTSIALIPLVISFFPLIGVIYNGLILYKILYAPRFFIVQKLTEIL